MSDESIKKNISMNIAKYREVSGMTQKELAKKLNITPSRVSNWEQGANCPTIDILFEVCEVLGVSINDIYGVYPTANMKLSYTEMEHIEKYRNLDSHGKEIVDFVLVKESERCERNKKRRENAAKKVATISEFPAQYLAAAHERTDIEVTEEMRQHDDAIMMDDSEWE